MMFFNVIGILIAIIAIFVYIFFITRTLIVAISSFTDVPFVSIRKKMIKKSLNVLKIEKGDSVLEIGSGSGRFLIYASKKYPNINFVGIEINSFLVYWSRIKAFFLGRKNIKFLKQDALSFSNYNDFNKIFLYMYPGFTKKLLNKYEKDFKRDTILVSAVFSFGKDFQKTHKVDIYPVKYINKTEKIYKWKK